MATCNKCGSPIKFKLLVTGKWCPTNPDGGEHWDDCKKAQRCGNPNEIQHRGPEFQPGRTGGYSSRVWNSGLVPWDESLGEFRQFTPAEVAAGIARRV
jgi:hypothetical protein